MFNGLLKDTLLGIVRHLATTSGGVLIAHGYMTNDQLQGWIGSLCFLAGIGWSVWNKYHNAKVRAL